MGSLVDWRELKKQSPHLWDVHTNSQAKKQRKKKQTEGAGGNRRQYSRTSGQLQKVYHTQGFPGGSAGKEPACNAGDLGSIPGLGRSPGEGNSYPAPVFWPGEFHELYSPWGIVHGVTKSRMWLGEFRLSLSYHMHNGNSRKKRKRTTWNIF